MNNDFSTQCERVESSSAAMLGDLAQIETALGDLQGEVAKLPFFVRGFVTSEVSRSTGQDVPAWAQTVGGLAAALREAQAAAGRARAAGTLSEADQPRVAQAAERLTTDQPRLEKLAAFMNKVPSRLNSVPGGMLPPERRGELLQAIEHQTQALQRLLDAMPDLEASLRALSAPR